MMERKYSPWFKLTACPTREGVYQCNDISPDKWYRFWDGANWCWGGFTIGEAYSNRHIPIEVGGCAEWRGLVK